MEKKKWLWKRKSSERSPGETESSESISSHSEIFSVEQDFSKASPVDSFQSPEVTSRSSGRKEDAHDAIKTLTERLSAALVNVSAKDDLVKQHSKVAEEAVAGWEKAENEMSALKKQLAAAAQQKSALQDRMSHLDGALRECVRQLRLAREEQEEKILEAVAKKSQQWESSKAELEHQLLEAKMKANVLSDAPVKIDPEILQKLGSLEQENASLKVELMSRSEELEIRIIERDLSTQAAETASKQHLESIKKVAKVEAECRKLRFMLGRSSSVIEHKTSAPSSIYVDSLTDSQSDSGERLNAVDIDAFKMNGPDPSRHEHSSADSWASTLISELGQVKVENFGNRNAPASTVKIDLMDDFLEMERLAALPATGTCHSEPEVIIKESNEVESALKTEIERLLLRTAELEERLQKLEGEKLKLEQKLEKTSAEKAEMEMALTKSHDEKEASHCQLEGAKLAFEELQAKLSSVYVSKQKIESQLISMEAEARTMSEKVHSLEAEVEKERALSKAMSEKCEEIKDELSRTKQEAELQQIANLNNAPKIKQEDLAVAAGKLAECQKTILSLGNQLKSLATLEDFLIDTAGLPDFPGKASLLPGVGREPWKLHSSVTFSPKRDSVSAITASENSGPSVSTNEDASPSSASSSASSTVLASNVSCEKNRHIFAKFFLRSKNDTQLEI